MNKSLPASTAIGEYVADLIQPENEYINNLQKLKKISGSHVITTEDLLQKAGKFLNPEKPTVKAPFSPIETKNMKNNPELPKMKDIIASYCRRQDGKVDIYDESWYVTHQGSKISLDEKCGFLKSK